jgi:hypothetical protein
MASIVYLVQHHPSRKESVKRLVSVIPEAVLITDEVSDPPDPWRGYRKCIAAIPEHSTHACILQDDAIPCEGFAAATEKIASANPNTPVCLFLGAFPAATAGRVRRSGASVRYVALGPSSFVPLVCVLWPTYVARQFLDWSSTARGMTRADDGNAARWVRATKQQIVVAVPSIVQHDDDQPSVKGGRDHKPWAEGWRRALLLADDATTYEW